MVGLSVPDDVDSSATAVVSFDIPDPLSLSNGEISEPSLSSSWDKLGL